VIGFREHAGGQLSDNKFVLRPSLPDASEGELYTVRALQFRGAVFDLHLRVGSAGMLDVTVAAAAQSRQQRRRLSFRMQNGKQVAEIAVSDEGFTVAAMQMQ